MWAKKHKSFANGYPSYSDRIQPKKKLVHGTRGCTNRETNYVLEVGVG